jgi:hypothetical protein
MTLRKTLFVVSLVASAFCLAAGFGLVGRWIGVGLAILVGLAWLLARKYPATWLPFICLLASVCLAVAGQLSGSSPVLMLWGVGAALAAWDLLLLNVSLDHAAFREQTSRHENRHLQALALALGCGLGVASFGRLLHIQLPFLVLLLLVVLAIFGLDRIWGYIKKRKINA